MSETKRRRPDDPKGWLLRARSSMIRAQMRAPDVFLEDLCFAQQAAEKAVKATYLLKRASPPRTHDLGVLLAGLEDTGVCVPAEVRDAVRLTRYAVLARYPSLDEPVSEDEYQEALGLAEMVVDWAAGLVGTVGGEE